MTKITVFDYTSANCTYEAGETIFKQGDEANLVYVIKTGLVHIVLNGEIIETLEKGDIFGEMALVDSSPRSASAVCETAATLVALDQNAFENYVHATPHFAVQMLKIMNNRLRKLMGVAQAA